MMNRKSVAGAPSKSEFQKQSFDGEHTTGAGAPASNEHWNVSMRWFALMTWVSSHVAG
jgi:hypothetical protein